MILIKEKTLTRLNVAKITNLLVLSSIAIFVPYFFHQQWITGPLVNAILILTLFLAGIRSAVIVCLVPSLMALAGGLLPPILAPAVPFIMISNIILVFSVDFIYLNFRSNNNQNYWLGVLVGAFFKFLFLYASINIISRLLIKQELVKQIAIMMSWPQFATAITGGFIAFIILKRLRRI